MAVSTPTKSTMLSKPFCAAACDDRLITTAKVPGPLRPGMASGVNAMSYFSPAALVIASLSEIGFGNSIWKPRNATIRPPAMRIPGSEMPKKFMIRPPATRKPDIRKNV